MLKRIQDLIWYLLRQLFFSLFQGSGMFLFLLQCCLVTCNQLLNCTCKRKNRNLGHSQTFRKLALIRNRDVNC